MAASRHAQFRIQMKTFEQLARLREIPRTTAWYLTDLSEARGKQELYTKQSPQRLKVFARACADRETVSSHIEGGEKTALIEAAIARQTASSACRIFSGLVRGQR
jgi:hypothetical protein